jgi:hypothetical protein
MKFIGAAASAGIERALSVNVGLRGEIHAALSGDREQASGVGRSKSVGTNRGAEAD